MTEIEKVKTQFKADKLLNTVEPAQMTTPWCSLPVVKTKFLVLAKIPVIIFFSRKEL